MYKLVTTQNITLGTASCDYELCRLIKIAHENGANKDNLKILQHDGKKVWSIIDWIIFQCSHLTEKICDLKTTIHFMEEEIRELKSRHVQQTC